jgi:hypothetical protein
VLNRFCGVLGVSDLRFGFGAGDAKIRTQWCIRRLGASLSNSKRH